MRCSMRWTRRPAKSCGRAAIRLRVGTTGAGYRSPTGACTSILSTAHCTRSTSRNRLMNVLGIGLLTGALLAALLTDAQRRLLKDWGGLTRYGSENSELKPPK